MSYLVTGAAGFIGSHIVNALLDLDHKVLGIDNLCTGNLENLKFVKEHPNRDNFTFEKKNLMDPSVCQEACKKVDFVIHQAALTAVNESFSKPKDYQDTNVGVTLNLLSAAVDHKIRAFVFASSAAVYGDNSNLPLSENEKTDPLSPYAHNKDTCEYYADLYASQFQLPVVLLRYFNVYGPRQNPTSHYAGVISKFIDAAVSGSELKIFGDGCQTRDFIYVDDVVKANILSCEIASPNKSKTINIGNSSQTSIQEIAEVILKITNSDSKILRLPSRTGDIVFSQSNNNQMISQLGLKSTTPLEVGLEATISWIQESQKTVESN